MEFKLSGTRFYFSFGFFVVLALYMLFDRTGVGLPAILAVALHECGHILVMRLTGVEIYAMRFYPFGLRLEKRGLLTYGREALVYLGGVAVNALCLVICLPLWGWNLFAGVNAALLLFNLLPVGRLDGGQILRLLLFRFGTPALAERVMKWVSLVILSPLFAAGFLLLRQGNCTLLITACYLAITLWR